MCIKPLTCFLDFFTNINETYDHSSYLFRSINYREHHLKPLYRPKLSKYCTPVKLPSSAMGINAKCEEKSNEHLTKNQTPRSKLSTNFRRCYAGQSYYPRTPQDTPGHPRTYKYTQRYLYSVMFVMFLHQIRFIFIECVIKSNITIKIY